MRLKNDLTFLYKCLSRRGSKSVEKLVASETEFLQNRAKGKSSMDIGEPLTGMISLFANHNVYK